MAELDDLFEDFRPWRVGAGPSHDLVLIADRPGSSAEVAPSGRPFGEPPT
jgi:hypothetical protein